MYIIIQIIMKNKGKALLILIYFSGKLKKKKKKIFLGRKFPG